PIVKNKAFVFGGFDNDLFSGSSVFTTTSLTPTPKGLATLAGCGSINPTALGILTKFGPYAFTQGAPTPRSTTTPLVGNPSFISTCPGVEYGGVTRVLSTPGHQFDFVLRSDIQIGGDNITARYLFNRNNNFNATGTGSSGWIGNVPALSQAML